MCIASVNVEQMLSSVSEPDERARNAPRLIIAKGLTKTKISGSFEVKLGFEYAPSLRKLPQHLDLARTQHSSHLTPAFRFLTPAFISTSSSAQSEAWLLGRRLRQHEQNA